jgi:hypothetical protein
MMLGHYRPLVDLPEMGEQRAHDREQRVPEGGERFAGINHLGAVLRIMRAAPAQAIRVQDRLQVRVGRLQPTLSNAAARQQGANRGRRLKALASPWTNPSSARYATLATRLSGRRRVRFMSGKHVVVVEHD